MVTLDEKNEALAQAIEALCESTSVKRPSYMMRTARSQAVWCAKYGQLNNLRHHADMGGLDMDEVEAVIQLIHDVKPASDPFADFDD